MALGHGPSALGGSKRPEDSGGRPCPPEFLSSIEDCIVTIDGTIRPSTSAVDAHPLLRLDEILPPEFVSSKTAAANGREYFAPFGVEDRWDLFALPPGADVTIDASTEFGNLREMLEAAVEFRID